MSKSIGGVALTALLESSMVSELQKKCTYLYLGKNVTKQKMNLMRLYNYWVILNACTLTDSEINCIVNDISISCDFNATKRLLAGQNDVRVEVPIQTAQVLSCYIKKTQGVPSAVGMNNGYGKFDVVTYGGSGPLTYLWTCEGVTGLPLDKIGSCGVITLVNTTTQRLEFSGIEYFKQYRFKITVTDSLGNTCSKSAVYDDGLGQVFVYVTVDPPAL